VLKKNICDGVGGQDESNGTPLDPPLFWLDNIFKFRVGKFLVCLSLNGRYNGSKSEKKLLQRGKGGGI
jgi:hypothetical protein